jgi:hypothetical protein
LDQMGFWWEIVDTHEATRAGPYGPFSRREDAIDDASSTMEILKDMDLDDDAIDMEGSNG